MDALGFELQGDGTLRLRPVERLSNRLSDVQRCYAVMRATAMALGAPVPPVGSNKGFVSAHYKLATEILRRSTEMSGPYQMFGKLVDLYIFTADGRSLRFEEVPIGLGRIVASC